MGSSYPGNDNWRGLDPPRQKTPHQHTRNDGSRNGNQNIHQGENSEIYSPASGQYDSPALHPKNGGTKNVTLIEITKRIWEYLLSNGITLTVEYIPSRLNKSPDWESRDMQDSSKWKLKPTVFRKVCNILGKPQIDLFTSRVTHQLPRYRPCRISGISPTPKVHELEDGSKQQSSNCSTKT